MKLDTSGLRAVIPELVSFGRRTVAEQCVTSLGMILQDTQTYGDNTIPFVEIGRMDAELDAPADSEKLAALGFTEGDAIVMARAAPDSNFNKITGSRWAFKLPSTASMRGFGRAYGHENAARMFLETVVNPIMERMRSARHSSGHFLQSGFKFPIQQCVSSPLFKNRYRAKQISANANPLNTLDAGKLGKLEMAQTDSPEFSVTAENNVGQDGNAVLDEKHRQALIAYASGPVQSAIEKETDACTTELSRRLEEKWPTFNKMLV